MSQSIFLMPTPLGTITSLREKMGQEGHQAFLLAHSRECAGRTGQHRLELLLEDATGSIAGIVWPESRAYVEITTCPAPVMVYGQVAEFRGQPQIHVRSLAVLQPMEVPLATGLLPRYRYAGEMLAAFDRLALLELSLPSPLDAFLRRVLLDPAIGIPFLRCRASVNHHHSFAGGLLVHSTEMLDLVAEATRLPLPHDPWAPSMAQLAYLLHDVGKLRSVGESARTRHGLVGRHEIMTIELLAPHLRWLELRSPELATVLRAVLGHLATPAKARGIFRYLVGEIVEKMDQWSAAAYNRPDTCKLLGLEPLDAA
jgi:hypothetical protein